MKSAFDLKSARLEALTLRLFTADLVVIAALLEEKAAQYAKFANMPFILDATRLQLQRADELDLAAVVALFAARDLRVVALQHGKKDWSEQANKAGLLWLDGGKKANRQPENDVDDVADNANNQHDADSNNDEAQSADNAVNQQTQPENAETVENNIEQPAEASAQEDNPTESTTDKPQPETLLTRKTVVVTSPVRTGQQVYAEQADLVVLGMVSEGAEIIADGNIHVYAPMRGRALAGESGDTSARIFLQSMQAELVSIAGIYRVFEQNLPPSLHKKAVQIELQDDERLAIFAINAN
ncbi:septum site-determining protein MinC [uncultured Kingella sp.]|uniref:septum site-determining protein MinC n=1 Tax=uncultured Kingella sp. TaxID=159270 RepID=UPI002597D79B|nr:septum site-determining protein MinC [uncultured Kingella sp.]